MDDFVAQLFSYIPEKWRPYAALLLLIVYVATKIRSHKKSAQIASLESTLKNNGVYPNLNKDLDAALAEKQPSKLSRITNRITNLFLNVVC